MILVVGASGFLGREVAALLLSQGETVRCMTRTPARLDELKRLGAEVIQGDLIEPISIRRACQGADRVLAAAHSLLGRGKYRSEAVDDVGHRNLIDCAREAGAAQFIYVSMRGASPGHPIDFVRTKYRIEEYLKASGLCYSILRPSAFMEWHAHIFNGKSILESGKTSLVGKGTKLRNFVAVRDVARFAVLALTDPRLQNRTLEVGGPGNFTNNQVAELYGKMAGLTPKIGRLPAGMAKALSLALKPFHAGLSRVLYVGSLPDEAFSERYDPAGLLSEFPLELTTLEEFVRERVREATPIAA